MTYQLIETKTLGTAAASIEFTSIPQDGTDLLALCSLRNTADFLAMTANPNGSTSNQTSRHLQGDGSGPNSFTTTTIQGLATNSTSTANTFAVTSFYFSNYTSATSKSVSVDTVTENNGTTAYQKIEAALWSDNTAISSITFNVADGTLAIGSTISLYKITKGSDGIVTTS